MPRSAEVRPGVKRIEGLTGTPSSNGLMDLWAEFRVLDMGRRLGRFITRYRSAYFQPDKRNAQVVFSYKPLPGAEDAIYERISDITISMRAGDYLDMPECVVNEVKVDLSEKERQSYDTMRAELVLSLNGEEVDAGNAAALANKLSQMANGAVYGEDSGCSGYTTASWTPWRTSSKPLTASPSWWPTLVQARPGAHPGAVHRPGDQDQPGYRRLEPGQDPGGGHPPGVRRPWAEPAVRRFHPGLVRADLVAGALPADQRPALAAGAERHNCGHPSHYHEEHH